MRLVVFMLALAGCSFHVPATGSMMGDDVDASVGGEGGNDPDSDIDGTGPLRDIPHVPASHETVGTVDLVFTATATINTTALTITGNPGGTFDAIGQMPSGPELAVLRLRSFQIDSTVTVSVVGSRPLVILADVITIAGALDASADFATPGAGGSAPGSGSGLGGAGVHSVTGQGTHDSGGGGGGFASAGGAGGVVGTTCSPQLAGGTAGGAFAMPLLEELRGGGAGGQGARGTCPDATAPGAGGGAVQLSAWTMVVIEIGGRINVGGGGGRGGPNCGTSNTGAGAGGGAGGAVYLDAPAITLSGNIAANGGGGGGGADGTVSQQGFVGANANVTGMVAVGGLALDDGGAAGGDGAAQATAPENGDTMPCAGNGGGGGGGIGRIVARLPVGATWTGAGATSPAITLANY